MDNPDIWESLCTPLIRCQGRGGGGSEGYGGGKPLFLTSAGRETREGDAFGVAQGWTREVRRREGWLAEDNEKRK